MPRRKNVLSAKNDVTLFRIGLWNVWFEKDLLAQWTDSLEERLFLFTQKNTLPPDLSVKNTPSQFAASSIDHLFDIPHIDETDYGNIKMRIYAGDKKEHLITIQNNKNEILFALSVESGWQTTTILSAPSPVGRRYCYEVLGYVLQNFALSKGGLIFHGVLMDYQGYGIILSAPSGTGKSTHAHLWRDHGYAGIINGDKALCRNIDGVWTGFGIPWCGSSSESENRQVPLAAIVVLEQSDVNSVQRLNPLDALTHLLPNIHAPKWETTLYNKALDRLDELIPEVPIYLLRCRPDVDAMMTLKQEMDRLPDQDDKA